MQLLREIGVHERMEREGLIHKGIGLAFSGRQERIEQPVAVATAISHFLGESEAAVDEHVDNRHTQMQVALFRRR